MKRKSSTRVGSLIFSHSLFSVFANPVRYVWAMSFAALGLGAGFFLFASLLFYWGKVSAYTALLSLSLLILGIVLFVLGVVVKQGNMIQRELWMLQSRQMKQERDEDDETEGEGERDYFRAGIGKAPNRKI
jgi:hypothetical protein